MDKPLLIFDGDCGFCRLWIARWKRLTGEAVRYAPSQEVGKDFPGIPLEEFQKAVHLVEPDGRHSSAAEAVFRALELGGWSWAMKAYRHFPGFSRASEFMYSVVAGHRPLFSFFTRWIWGTPGEPVSYRRSRWLFLRALALIYGIAFSSLAVQVKGLLGEQGISPARVLLEQARSYPSILRYWYLPTLAWWSSTDAFLVGMCVLGVVVSVLAFLNIAPRVVFAMAWILYLSLVSVGGVFMSFQWDALLLETGFLAIFFSPPGLLPQCSGVPSPPPLLVFLLRWLLFRLMVQSALVKWLSGDPLWHQFTALTVHYQTQPLPNPLSWYVHHWPIGFHKLSCLGMFVIEGLIPFLIFAPRKPRLLAFWSLVGLQGLIFLTGNYTYFNLLAITLCLPLLDDSMLRQWVPAWCDEPLTSRSGADYGIRGLVILVFILTSIPFARVLGRRIPGWVSAPAVWVSPLRSFNTYGLFAVMTPERPEIILEGSDDGKDWKAYEFKYKPGSLDKRPAQVAPHQPRLDWQLWFAALSDYRQNPWFLNFCVRLLQGSKPVNDLLAKNPFPTTPPAYLRARLYEYRFTTPGERRQTGHWWVRQDKGLYIPVLSFKK